jgi:hypothetical protein
MPGTSCLLDQTTGTTLLMDLVVAGLTTVSLSETAPIVVTSIQTSGFYVINIQKNHSSTDVLLGHLQTFLVLIV